MLLVSFRSLFATAAPFEDLSLHALLIVENLKEIAENSG